MVERVVVVVMMIVVVLMVVVMVLEVGLCFLVVCTDGGWQVVVVVAGW